MGRKVAIRGPRVPFAVISASSARKGEKVPYEKNLRFTAAQPGIVKWPDSQTLRSNKSQWRPERLQVSGRGFFFKTRNSISALPIQKGGFWGCQTDGLWMRS